MAFTLPNGKVARTLTEQVKFLTEKLKDLYAEVNRLGFKIVIVDGALPLEGEPRTLYLVEITPPDTDNYYEEYIWINDAWEMIGTTQVDLTNYVTKDGPQTITGNKTFEGNTHFAYTGEVTFASSPKFGANILPYVNDNSDIGSASYAWKDLYMAGRFNIVSSSNTFYITNSGNYITIGLGSTVFCNWGSSGLTLSTNLKNSNGNTYDIGASGTPWRDLYLSGKVYNSVFVVNNGSADVFKIDGINGEVKTNYTIQPVSNGGASLGKSSSMFANLFLSGNLSNGTDTATVADIAALITYAKAQGWIS